MISDWSERSTRRLQAILALAWVVVVASLLWPATSRFTDPADAWALAGWTVTTPDGAAHPYPIGLRLWWNIAIPAFIVIILVFGHDTWRRICPLSFFAQIPRRFGFSRTRHQADGSRLPALIAPDSWWGRHALMVQFTLLWLALSARLVLINSNAIALVAFLAGTVLVAFLIGLLYGGKTWCHYVCPMAPVQFVYAGPRGLLGKSAAQGTRGLSQSMCRQPSAQGDVSACVGCNAPCPDVDLERHYWESNERRERRLIVYGYLGLVIGFLLQQELQGTNYNAAGFWFDQQMSSLAEPGWIIAGHPWPVPRWLAAPLMLALTTIACMGMGWGLENWAARRLPAEQTRHRLMIASAVLALGLLLWFRVIPGLKIFPPTALAIVGAVLVGAVTLWAARSWHRTRTAWQRDHLAASVRRRLATSTLDLAPALAGRSLEELSVDEIHLLARVVGDQDAAQRQRLYRDVVKDLAAHGQAAGTTADAVLAGLRQQWGISDDEHRAVIAEIATSTISDPRLHLCQAELEQLIMRHLAAGHSLSRALTDEAAAIDHLRERYGISAEQLQAIATELAGGDGVLARAAMALAEQIAAHERWYAALATPDEHGMRALTQRRLDERGRSLITSFISVLEALGEQTTALQAAQRAVGTVRLATGSWRSVLPTTVVQALADARLSDIPSAETALAELIRDEDPFIALCAVHQRHVTDSDVVARLRDDPRLPSALRSALTTQRQQRIAIAVDQLSPRIFTQTPIVIGRDGTCDVVIAHPHTSRRHARLEQRDGSLWLQDTSGTNGTQVDGRWVHGEAVRLTLPTTVRIGGASGPTLHLGLASASHDDPVVLLARIGASTIGSSLSCDALMALTAVTRVVHHAPGQRLLQVGQPVDALRIVLTGSAVARDDSGRDLGRIGPGETIGELGLLAGESASASVFATSALSCVELPAERFRALLQDAPGTAHTLLVHVCRRLIATVRPAIPTSNVVPNDTDLSATIVPR